MNMRQRICKDDTVQVISGDHRGARGKILRLDPKRNEVVVEGVNLAYRHVRPTRKNPQGGRVQKELPIHISNVQPVDASTGKPTRIRYDVERNDVGHVTSKKRVSTAGNVLHVLSRAENKRK